MRVLLLLRGAAGGGKSTWIEKNGLKPYAVWLKEMLYTEASPQTLNEMKLYVKEKDVCGMRRMFYQKEGGL